MVDTDSIVQSMNIRYYLMTVQYNRPRENCVIMKTNLLVIKMLKNNYNIFSTALSEYSVRYR